MVRKPKSVRARGRTLFFRWGTMRARARALFSFRWGLPESVAGCHSLAGGTLWGRLFLSKQESKQYRLVAQEGCCSQWVLGDSFCHTSAYCASLRLRQVLFQPQLRGPSEETEQKGPISCAKPCALSSIKL